MIAHRRLPGEMTRLRAGIRGSGLWSIPASARAFLLFAEFCALATTIGLVLGEQATRTTIVRFVVLIALSVGYSEFAARSERIRQYLGSDRISAAPLSVWSFAAVLTMPAGWAAALILVQYGHALLQARRDSSGRPYRLVFSAAVTVLAQLAASLTIDRASGGAALHGQLRSSLAVVAGGLVFTALNLALLMVGMWLAARPPRIRSMLPDRDAVGYELATLVLGMAAAEFLLHTAALVPVILVLVAYVHRSSVVKALQHAAQTDTKTGLMNASAWSVHANNALSRSARTGQPVAVLVVDIDHFKPINDTHGHLIGDEVLVAVATCLRRELRGHDGLGRFGGDEFVAILEQLAPGAAEQVGERLRSAVSSLQIADRLSITVSIGLAHGNADDTSGDIQGLLERADAALYLAKSSGRNQLCTAGSGRV